MDIKIEKQTDRQRQRERQRNGDRGILRERETEE